MHVELVRDTLSELSQISSGWVALRYRESGEALIYCESSRFEDLCTKLREAGWLELLPLRLPEPHTRIAVFASYDSFSSTVSTITVTNQLILGKRSGHILKLNPGWCEHGASSAGFPLSDDKLSRLIELFQLVLCKEELPDGSESYSQELFSLSCSAELRELVNGSHLEKIVGTLREAGRKREEIMAKDLSSAISKNGFPRKKLRGAASIIWNREDRARYLKLSGEGAVVAVCGASGAGKTTQISGVKEEFEGVMKIDSIDLGFLREPQRVGRLSKVLLAYTKKFRVWRVARKTKRGQVVLVEGYPVFPGAGRAGERGDDVTASSVEKEIYNSFLAPDSFICLRVAALTAIGRRPDLDDKSLQEEAVEYNAYFNAHREDPRYKIYPEVRAPREVFGPAAGELQKLLVANRSL